MGILDEFAKDKSQFVSIKEGEELVCEIIDYQKAMNMNGDTVIAYKIIPQGLNSEKILQSGSIRLAKAIASLPDAGKGCMVKIKKTGSGFDTRYSVTELST